MKMIELKHHDVNLRHHDVHMTGYMTPVVEPLAEAEILTFLVSGFSGMSQR